MRDDTPPELRDQRFSPRDDALVPREIVSLRLSVPLPENGSLVCTNELFGDERKASAEDLIAANGRMSITPPPLPAKADVVDSEDTQALPVEQAEELTVADNVSDVAVPTSVSTTPHPIWQS